MSKVISSATVYLTESLPNGKIIQSEIGISFDVSSYKILDGKLIIFTLSSGRKVTSRISSYNVKEIAEKKRKS